MTNVTRKQRRSAKRVEEAKRKKIRNYRLFLFKMLARKIGEEPIEGFCCSPRNLGMDREEFFGQGEELSDGSYFFPRGKLAEILRNWTCTASQNPHILRRDYIEARYHPSGARVANL